MSAPKLKLWWFVQCKHGGGKSGVALAYTSEEVRVLLKEVKFEEISELEELPAAYTGNEIIPRLYNWEYWSYT